MYLQRLEIQGFKSFAQKTVFEFPEKSHHDAKAHSISAIVGPNGSGKSNVADAIRWVLGEQSLKLIRCKKSDDVIFGGSHTKARQGFAEVSLILNNEDKVLPIDYSEVVLTRRVYRNGETEYLINKKKARLFDILMLTAKANFGQKSYSIVGQGMVDHIINISPFERKEFFDEATGVKQYQIKRDQAVNRLRRSRDNLDQTNHILAELEPRLRLLTRQVKKLEKRKDVEKQLRDLQKKYYAVIYQTVNKEKIKHSEKFDIKDVLKKDLEVKMEAIQTELAKSAREESRKDIFNNLQKDYNKLFSEKNELLKDLATIKGKMSLEYTKIGKQNLSWMENKREELAKRLSEIKESLNNLENKLQSKNKILLENQKQVLDFQDQLVVLQNNLNTAEADLHNLKNGGRVNANLESIKAILRQKSYIKGIHGSVGELGKVDEMYETALATSAGGRLLAVVVQDEKVAVQCIAYLKEHRLRPVTFLPLNKIKGFSPRESDRDILKENGAIAFAQDVVTFDPKFKKIFQYLFGNTVVVDNLENAKHIGVGRERMVTLEGDVLEKTGAMKGGYRGKGSMRWQMIDDNSRGGTQEEKLKEIALLKSKIEDFLRKKERLIEENNSLKVEIQVAETKQKGLNNDYAELTKEKGKLEDEISDNQVAPEDQDKFLKNLTAKKEEFERQVDSIDEKVIAIRKKIDQFNLEEEDKKNKVFGLQNEMQEYQIKLNEVNQEVNEINIALARLDTKREELDKEVAQELGAEIDFNKINTDEIINTDQVWFDIGKLKHSLEQIGGIDQEVVDEHQEVTERFEFLSTQSTDLEKAIKDLEKIVVELDVVINKQFNASFKLINKSFGHYFEKIFSGGKARLELVQKERHESTKAQKHESMDPNEKNLEDDLENEEDKTLPENKSKLVNTGVEIMVAPPNKKIANIAVLSGGERTMTSLALICAIIDSNPSPFVVMDEVEAALDEANSEKFAAILQELSYKSQFILISHNRITMHVADTLFGVAMGDDGVSKTLALSLKDAEKTVEKDN